MHLFLELTHGRNTAERIVMLYRVAAALDLSYVYVIHHPTPITVSALQLLLLFLLLIQSDHIILYISFLFL